MKKFFVLQAATNGGYETEEEAIAYARAQSSARARQGYNDATTEYLVVKAVGKTKPVQAPVEYEKV